MRQFAYCLMILHVVNVLVMQTYLTTTGTDFHGSQ